MDQVSFSTWKSYRPKLWVSRGKSFLINCLMPDCTKISWFSEVTHRITIDYFRKSNDHPKGWRNASRHGERKWSADLQVWLIENFVESIFYEIRESHKSLVNWTVMWTNICEKSWDMPVPVFVQSFIDSRLIVSPSIHLMKPMLAVIIEKGELCWEKKWKSGNPRS